MKIRTVTYRATVTPSEYQGGSTMTRSMEATAELEEGVCPDYELGKLVDYVHEALAELRRGYAQDSPGQGPHPCHYAGYTCRRPAKFRLVSGLCWAVTSTLKVWRVVNQISQATPLASSYRSFSLR